MNYLKAMEKPVCFPSPDFTALLAALVVSEAETLLGIIERV
jgi:hypothetical protein